MFYQNLQLIKFPKYSALEVLSKYKSQEKVIKKKLKLIPIKVKANLIRFNDEKLKATQDFHSEIQNLIFGIFKFMERIFQCNFYFPLDKFIFISQKRLRKLLILLPRNGETFKICINRNNLLDEFCFVNMFVKRKFLWV